MALVERRQLDELLAIFKLEPSLRHVFVEGDFDKAILERFIYEHGRKRTTVYSISLIDIKSEVVRRHGAQNNNRGRVIALAKEFSLYVAPDSVLATCVVDADFDIVMNRVLALPHLLYTDFTSMGLYFVGHDTLSKVFALFVRAPFERDIMRLVYEIAVRAYLFRLAKEQLCPAVPWLTITRSCNFDGDVPRFDPDDFLFRMLVSGGAIQHRDSIIAFVADKERDLSDDPRLKMHEHDLIELLSWYIGKVANTAALHNPAIVERAICTAANFRDLAEYPLFQKILERTA